MIPNTTKLFNYPLKWVAITSILLGFVLFITTAIHFFWFAVFYFFWFAAVMVSGGAFLLSGAFIIESKTQNNLFSLKALGYNIIALLLFYGYLKIFYVIDFLKDEGTRDQLFNMFNRYMS